MTNQGVLRMRAEQLADEIRRHCHGEVEACEIDYDYAELCPYCDSVWEEPECDEEGKYFMLCCEHIVEQVAGE